MRDFDFGNYLCALREKSGISQKELAKRAGVSDKAVSKWENGRSKPKSAIIARLAEIFGVSADELLSGGKKTSHDERAVISPLDGNAYKYPYKSGRKEKMNFIPGQSVRNCDYLCTWCNQKSASDDMSASGDRYAGMRDALRDSTLFGKKNYYHTLEEAYRPGLYFMVDDGWDVPPGAVKSPDYPNMFGWCDPDPEKFPGYGETPAKRLGKLREKVMSLGYAGLGLWISPQMRYEDEKAPADLQTSRGYWEERAGWCHEAGVDYWKIDWGVHMWETDYRRMLTEAARKYAPGLVVEHAFCQPPYSGMGDIGRRKHFVSELLAFSDVLRLYDVTEPFEDSSMLSRINEALSSGAKPEYGAKGILNAETCAEICASLGCAAGVMSVPQSGGMMRACLRWHRIAPPYSVFGSVYRHSAERLSDSFYFEKDPAGWIHVKGQTLTESAPAVMARDCELPEVSDEAVKPFVCASKNPSGAYSIASVKRTIDPNSGYTALADVTFRVGGKDAPVGVFGNFRSLALVYESKIGDARIFAQNMLEDSAKDITGGCVVDGNRVTIDGKLLRHDTPAFIIKLIEE